MGTFLIVFLIFLGIGLLIFLFYPILKKQYEYKNHRKIVAKTLYKYASDYDVFLLNNVKLKYGDETIIFDHILFGEKFIYCIKDECQKVGIEGNAEDLKWFSFNLKGDFEYIPNPFKSNNLNVVMLSHYLKINIEDRFFYSIICVNDSCLINVEKCKDDEIIINHKNLYNLIKNKERDNSYRKINQERLQKVVKILYEQTQGEN